MSPPSWIWRMKTTISAQRAVSTPWTHRQTFHHLLPSPLRAWWPAWSCRLSGLMLRWRGLPPWRPSSGCARWPPKVLSHHGCTPQVLTQEGSPPNHHSGLHAAIQQVEGGALGQPSAHRLPARGAPPGCGTSQQQEAIRAVGRHVGGHVGVTNVAVKVRP